MVPQSVLVGASFQHSIKCNYIITFVGNHSYVSEDNPRWRCPSDATLLIKCCWNSLDHRLSLNNIAPSNDLNARSSVYTQEAFSLSLSDAKHNFDGLWWTLTTHHLIFLCPQLIWILFVFLLKVQCIAPRWSAFQEVSRNVDVILVKDFANLIDVLIWQSFLFWNQISYFNGHVYSSLIVEMKSERYQFWKVFLEIKLVWSKIQHTLFNVVLWLSCILKTEIDPV
jgi:hypothetical protein